MIPGWFVAVRKRVACAAMAMGVAMLVSAASFSASELPRLSSDPRVQEALALVENGRFREALAALRRLAPDHPDRVAVLFLVGRAAVGASQLPTAGEEDRIVLLDEAIAALRTILVGHPRLDIVRLDLARAFFLKGEDDLARKHFERVLAGDPHPRTAASIRSFLDAIRARRRWSGHLSFALASDSNVNSASEDDVIFLRGLPFRHENRPQSGWGVEIGAGGEYQHPLGDRLRLRLGAGIWRREHAGRDFDRTVLSGHLGPRWLADADADLSLLAVVRHARTAGETDHNGFGARLEAVRRLGRRMTVDAQASSIANRHRQSKFLDGNTHTLLLGASWLATPTVRAEARIGYSRELPKSAASRNSSHSALLDVSVLMPLGFTLGAGARIRRTKYQGSRFTLDGANRRDLLTELHLSLFNRGLTVHGFSPKLTLVNERRRTNEQLLDYKRTRAELHMIRQF